MEITVFLVPGLAGERAAGQRRQTIIFVVVLAVVFEKAEKRSPCLAAPADSLQDARWYSPACMVVFPFVKLFRRFDAGVKLSRGCKRASLQPLLDESHNPKALLTGCPDFCQSATIAQSVFRWRRKAGAEIAQFSPCWEDDNGKRRNGG